SDSLSTPRRAGDPAPARDSLPAVGQTLLGGLSPARFQRKVSECVVTSHPPSPSFAWRNLIVRGVSDRRARRDRRAAAPARRLPRLVALLRSPATNSGQRLC